MRRDFTEWRAAGRASARFEAERAGAPGADHLASGLDPLTPAEQARWCDLYDEELARAEPTSFSPADNTPVDDLVSHCQRTALRFRIARFQAYAVWNWLERREGPRRYAELDGPAAGEDWVPALDGEGRHSIAHLDEEDEPEQLPPTPMQRGFVYLFVPDECHGGTYRVHSAYAVENGLYRRFACTPDNIWPDGLGPERDYIDDEQRVDTAFVAQAVEATLQKHPGRDWQVNSSLLEGWKLRDEIQIRARSYFLNRRAGELLCWADSHELLEGLTDRNLHDDEDVREQADRTASRPPRLPARCRARTGRTSPPTQRKHLRRPATGLGPRHRAAHA